VRLELRNERLRVREAVQAHERRTLAAAVKLADHARAH
jgi:hypothetical protein